MPVCAANICIKEEKVCVTEVKVWDIFGMRLEGRNGGLLFCW